MPDLETVDLQEAMADWVEGVIDRAVNDSSRSRQSKTNVLGVSDIGNCHEYVRRMILDEEPSQEVHKYDLAAFIGTAIGDHVEDAVHQEDVIVGLAGGTTRDWVKQQEVTVKLTVRGFDLEIPGHPDLYCPTDLIDFKTKDGLGVIRRTGPSGQERFQRSLYAKALIERGDMDEDAWLHNVYIDRSGRETRPVVWSSKFDWAEVGEAIAWLDDVMYAVQMGEEAYRDPPREWCWACCPFAPQCRGIDDTDVQGKITDPFVIEAIKVFVESSEQIKALEKDKESAKSVLTGLSGATDDYTVRSTWVNGGHVEYDRSGYERLDVRPVRRKPGAKRVGRTDVRGAGEVPPTEDGPEVPGLAGVQGEADVV